ncbi:hypothetical protein BC937DRAFT_94282 [Endogone sp. FLAS-F59071]|nr:hypothetical protein BC937DRAFT_94282 [Endogone sp. FLAS-F59071]|eukprot:RUS20833.1 hypothetical protein BC937DRAFT_94282 [Endogone sp. FLAS-F59071]
MMDFSADITSLSLFFFFFFLPFAFSKAMDDTLAEVVKHCALQLDMYQRCVESYPNDWDKQCLQQRRALTKCSDENVGVLRFVKERCSSQVTAYDLCLGANAAEPEKCIDALRQLYLCTEVAATSFRQQQPNVGKAPKSAATAVASPSTNNVSNNVFMERTTPPKNPGA